MKALLGVLSLLVLAVTGYYWGQVGGANSGLTTASVLDSDVGPEPLDGSMDILLVGMDSRTDSQGHPLDPNILKHLHVGADKGELNTDTMMLVHIPQNAKHATAISLPRDSVVNRPGFGMGKLNSAFLAARNTKLRQLKAQGMQDKAKRNRLSKEAGSKELVKTIELLTGVKIEHYAAVNLVGFYNISQAIGGVKVCLKKPAFDSHTGVHFDKGVQTVEGKKALAFVRQRHGLPKGDLSRERRQQAFLASMAHKVLSAGVLSSPSKLNSLVDAVRKSLTVDENWNLFKFARQMQGLTSGNITFATIPVAKIDAYSPGFGSYVKVNPQQVKAFLHKETGPNSKKPGGSQQSTETPDPQADNAVDHSATTVSVSNAAGISGMAGRTLDVLTGKGFGKGGTANAAPRQSSIVRYASGSKAAAQQVSKVLGGGLTLRRDTSLADGNVRVVLGSAYSGPGRNATGGTSAGSGTSSSQQTGTTTKAPKPPAPPIVQHGDGPPCVN